MRLAVVDVGNTSTAAGLWVNGRVSRVVHIDGSIDEAFAAVSQICDLGIDALAYVSVVPKRDPKWRAFAKRKGLEFRSVTHENAGRIVGIDYPKPETIGGSLKDLLFSSVSFL